jgi:DNA-binding response OmpR family regulator
VEIKLKNNHSLILIIEDDISAARLAEYTLEHAGYEVIKAHDGYEGLSKAIKHHPDLIILDIMLPGIDGFEVCQRLRERPDMNTMPILVISAKSQEEDIRFGMEIGASEYITKPVEPAFMLEKIAGLLHASQ